MSDESVQILPFYIHKIRIVSPSVYHFYIYKCIYHVFTYIGFCLPFNHLISHSFFVAIPHLYSPIIKVFPQEILMGD